MCLASSKSLVSLSFQDQQPPFSDSFLFLPLPSPSSNRRAPQKINACPTKGSEEKINREEQGFNVNIENIVTMGNLHSSNMCLASSKSLISLSFQDQQPPFSNSFLFLSLPSPSSSRRAPQKMNGCAL